MYFVGELVSVRLSRRLAQSLTHLDLVKSEISLHIYPDWITV